MESLLNNDIQNTSLLVLLFAGMLVFYLYVRNKHKRSRPRHSASQDHDHVKKITSGTSCETYSHGSSGPGKNILCRSTGFGTVYKGEFRRVELGVMSDKDLDYFEYKISFLTQVRHRHLAALSDFFLDGNERILVHEYMPQRTLSRFLFDWKEEGIKHLEWAQRLIIASDVGIGVAHLHALPQMIVHTDLKPSNILLGDDMRAKVAYFGFDEKNSVATTKLDGTLGHLAPEYAVLGLLTTKIDVFAFGVILMQMITGRRALDQNLPDDQQHLVGWFRRMLINKDTFCKAIDPTLDLNEETYASIGIMAELAGHCTAMKPYQRPDMRHVVNVLSSLANPDNVHGIDYGMITFIPPKAVKRCQSIEEMYCGPSSFIGSNDDNTQTSIPSHLPGFVDSSTDLRL